jgi:hypothetical protein
MREVATIAEAFFNLAQTVSGIAKVQFVTQFNQADLRRISQTPLLLINPHLMYLAYARHRQRGTQLMVTTVHISRDQRGEREWNAALDIMGTLDDLDSVIVNNNLGLDIQPFDIYHRNSVEVEKGWSVVRTIYSTVVYRDLATSKFTYYDIAGLLQTVEFPMISTSSQTEKDMDNNDYARVLDGSMRVYHQSSKRRYELRFTLISSALKAQLQNLKAAKTELSYYRDKNAAATISCYWVNDFDFYEEQSGRWTGSIVLYES